MTTAAAAAAATTTTTTTTGTATATAATTTTTTTTNIHINNNNHGFPPPRMYGYPVCVYDCNQAPAQMFANWGSLSFLSLVISAQSQHGQT